MIRIINGEEFKNNWNEVSEWLKKNKPKRIQRKRTEESKVEREKRKKWEKPYLSCTWYGPYGSGECDGECDDGLGPCRDYKED